MFGIGMTELLVILGVALVVFGPKRLPELARGLGRALGEFRNASNDLQRTLHESANQVPPTPSPPKAPEAPTTTPGEAPPQAGASGPGAQRVEGERSPAKTNPSPSDSDPPTPQATDTKPDS